MFFIVLRKDRISHQLLIPLDLRKLIPKDYPCYFIQNVVDEIDFSKVDLNLKYTREQKRKEEKEEDDIDRMVKEAIDNMDNIKANIQRNNTKRTHTPKSNKIPKI